VRTAAQRRRLAALLAVGVLAAGAGAGVGAGGDGDVGSAPSAVEGVPRPQAPPPQPAEGDGGRPAPGTEASRREVAQLTPLQRAGTTIVLRFAGTTAPPYVLRALRERRAGGVILFRDNIVSPPQLRRMTRAFARASRGRALVMTDQEGGEIRNVRWIGPQRSQPRQGGPARIRAAAREAGRRLRAHGITVNLAPVADPRTPPGALTSRTFSGAVPAAVRASVRGFAAAGVLATAKHFPGLAGARENTDFAPTTIPGRPDLSPFRAAIAARVPLVMAGHALHPALDPDRIASQSPRILTGLLRDRLGFTGAVITDSLEARAVVTRTDTPTAALRSLRAGADVLLTTGPGSYLQVLRRLRAAQRADRATARRIDEAAARVLALTEPDR